MPEKIELRLSTDEVNVILQALQEQPFRTVHRVIDSIVKQLTPSNNESA